eukprot:6211849-Pleurochrysis_carterae.AAC.10
MCAGLSSRVLRGAISAVIVGSRSAWARIMRSMLAVQPHSSVTRTHGEFASREDNTTFCTKLPRTCLVMLHRACSLDCSSLETVADPPSTGSERAASEEHAKTMPESWHAKTMSDRAGMQGGLSAISMKS